VSDYTLLGIVIKINGPAQAVIPRSSDTTASHYIFVHYFRSFCFDICLVNITFSIMHLICNAALNFKPFYSDCIFFSYVSKK